jgi:hypothetical protein
MCNGTKHSNNKPSILVCQLTRKLNEVGETPVLFADRKRRNCLSGKLEYTIECTADKGRAKSPRRSSTYFTFFFGYENSVPLRYVHPTFEEQKSKIKHRYHVTSFPCNQTKTVDVVHWLDYIFQANNRTCHNPTKIAAELLSPYCLWYYYLMLTDGNSC